MSGWTPFASSTSPPLPRATPPSAIEEAARAGKAWAESVTERICISKKVAAWPLWPPYDDAPKRSRRHAAKLVAPLHVHVTHPRPRDKELREPEAMARRRRASEALIRLCYEAARARYAELAAWRLT